MKSRGLVYIDIDGTINFFRVSDNRIIREIFNKHYLVLLLDTLLWKINELDFISNSMYIFKFRIFIYSIISFTSYCKNIKEYERLYIEYTLEDVTKSYTQHLERLKDLGYEIHLVTHNKFAKAFSHKFPVKVLKNKPKHVKKVKKYICYMIGNNYTDDLRMPISLGIKTIYVGESKLVKKVTYGKAKHFSNIEDAVNYIIEQDKNV